MMAPYNGDSMLLNQHAMTQAQSYDQVKAFVDLPSLIPQRAGSRSRRSHRSRRSRRQRGGMSPFATAFDTPIVPQGAEMNPQFRTESMVIPGYGESRGAQT